MFLSVVGGFVVGFGFFCWLPEPRVRPCVSHCVDGRCAASSLALCLLTARACIFCGGGFLSGHTPCSRGHSDILMHRGRLYSTFSEFMLIQPSSLELELLYFIGQLQCAPHPACFYHTTSSIPSNYRADRSPYQPAFQKPQHAPQRIPRKPQRRVYRSTPTFVST